MTLLEKLDALIRRLLREDAAPATFVRHFEDAARIVQAKASPPPLTDYAGVRALAEEMLVQKQIAILPTAAHPAFAPDDSDRWRAVLKAHEALGPMFWGPRLSIKDACADLRAWLTDELG